MVHLCKLKNGVEVGWQSSFILQNWYYICYWVLMRQRLKWTGAHIWCVKSGLKVPYWIKKLLFYQKKKKVVV